MKDKTTSFQAHWYTDGLLPGTYEIRFEISRPGSTDPVYQ